MLNETSSSLRTEACFDRIIARIGDSESPFLIFDFRPNEESSLALKTSFLQNVSVSAVHL